jgi:hypothetical protein
MGSCGVLAATGWTEVKCFGNGKETALVGDAPVITSTRKGILHIAWPLKSIEGTLLIDINEREIKMVLKSQKAADWFLVLTASDKIELPFTRINRSKIDCKFEGFDYAIKSLRGEFVSSDAVPGFKIYPENNQVILNLSQ